MPYNTESESKPNRLRSPKQHATKALLDELDGVARRLRKHHLAKRLHKEPDEDDKGGPPDNDADDSGMDEELFQKRRAMMGR